MFNIGLFNLLFDKSFLITMVAGILSFATIATLVLPLLEKGGLDDRLKSVSKRREELRARHHAALNAKRGSLRVEPSTWMKSVLDRFKLGTALESENSRDKLAQAGYRSVKEKGIDPSRIEMRIGSMPGRFVNNILVPPGATFDQIATLASATMRGLVIMALSTPDIAARHEQESPFGGDVDGEWSLPAIGIAGVVLTYLEPDPDVIWDANRKELVRDTVQSWA